MKGRADCLTCGETVDKTVRGCCERCVHRHRYHVRRGHTTWRALERAGLTRPPSRRHMTATMRAELARRLDLVTTETNPFFTAL